MKTVVACPYNSTSALGVRFVLDAFVSRVRCLAEYCRDVGIPSSTEATFLRSRRHRHRERYGDTNYDMLRSWKYGKHQEPFSRAWCVVEFEATVLYVFDVKYSHEIIV